MARFHRLDKKLRLKERRHRLDKKLRLTERCFLMLTEIRLLDEPKKAMGNCLMPMETPCQTRLVRLEYRA